MRKQKHGCYNIPKRLRKQLKRQGRLLRYLRLKKRLTQRDVAITLGCSQSLISRIERGVYNAKVGLLKDLYIVLEYCPYNYKYSIR